MDAKVIDLDDHHGNDTFLFLVGSVNKKLFNV